MLHALLQFLQDCLQPLSVVWLLITWSAGRQLWRRQWRAAVSWLLPWVVLTVFACTSLPSWLVYGLEKRWANVDFAALPSCDAVVCLGGGAQPSLTEATGLHFSGSADRVATALQALASGKAKELVLGGGGFQQEGSKLMEADAVKAWLDRNKLSLAPVTSLGYCANTRDEATKVATLCAERGWKRVLLVTSAIHMARAEATFIKAGVNVTCLPCNFHSSQLRTGSRSTLHLPHTAELEHFYIWCHEVAGSQVYRWRGWL